MDSFMLSTATTPNKFSPIRLFSHSFFYIKKSPILSFNTREPRKLIVFASKDESKLDQWDQMELKFGRMLGEDPKITYAKVPSFRPFEIHTRVFFFFLCNLISFRVVFATPDQIRHEIQCKILINSTRQMILQCINMNSILLIFHS